MAENTIELHTCYGNEHRLIIEGRLVESRNYIEREENDSFLRNGWRKLKQLVNDEIKDAPLILHVKDEKISTYSDDEGYFELDVNFSKKLFNGEKVEIELLDQNLTLTCFVTILENKKRVGIISDFDDTVVISDVTNKVKLVYNLMFENYKQRDVVKGMVERFDHILSANDSNTPLPLFFITGSPKQLFKSINRFLDHHFFPEHILITKKIHGDNSDSLFHQTDYKSKKIEKLIALYPSTEWVMFGDSGEKDREIYLEMVKKYPAKIKEVYIRNVDNGEISKIYSKSK